MIALVLLRVTIGWHFLYQGIWKLQTPNFSAAGFLGQAKGPLAKHFYDMLPDVDGRAHLDLDSNLAGMKEYAEQFAKVNKLSEPQVARAAVVLEKSQEQLRDFLLEPAAGKKPRQLQEPFAEHLYKLDKLDGRKTAAMHNVPFEQKRIWDEQAKLRGQAAAWSKEIDGIWQDFKTDLHAVMGDQPVRDPSEHKTELAQIDRLVTFTNIAIGVCLIVGFLSRFSAFAGALFLAQIVAAQPDWPGLYPVPHPSAGRSLIVNKEFVEMMALVALGCLPVGRWCGLDYIVHHGIVRRLARKRENV